MIRWSWFAGARLIRAGIVTELAEVKQERNAALLKVIEKESDIVRLSEQLQSECQTLVPSSSSPRAHHDFSSLFIF
jgi:TorA maturation chaperone TorD